jgi:hypothetical protein
MVYRRSIREISLDEEPMASAIAAVLPDEEESPGSTEMRWDNATEDQLYLLRTHPEAKYVVGVRPEDNEPSVGDGGVSRP